MGREMTRGEKVNFDDMVRAHIENDLQSEARNCGSSVQVVDIPGKPEPEVVVAKDATTSQFECVLKAIPYAIPYDKSSLNRSAI